jgi:hypothetical protein
MNLARNDDFTWPKSKDGEYTVKSGYQVIKDWKEDSNNPSTSNNNSPSPIWQKIWNLKIPPKHSSLIWRILHNALPVTNKLRKKGINCYTLCHRCTDAIEDQSHVFSKCIWAQQIWFASPLTIRFANQNQTFNEWLEDRIINSSTQSLELICAIYYHIWKVRNLLIFQNKIIHVIEVLRNTLDSLAEYKNQQLKSSQTPAHRTNRNRSNNVENWKPPPQNNLKLNVDAHRLADDGRWALGMSVLHRDRKIIIEMDNNEVVKAVHKNRYPRQYWGQIAPRGGDYIRANPTTTSLQWVRRTGNEAAHQMDKRAAIEPNRTWVENYPPHIVALIQNEIKAISVSLFQ